MCIKTMQPFCVISDMVETWFNPFLCGLGVLPVVCGYGTLRDVQDSGEGVHELFPRSGERIQGHPM